MRQYSDKPTEFVKPSDAEVVARSKRNMALAISLAVFVIFVFFTMISRANGAA